MMIRPTHFGYNSETALDNVYQKKNKKVTSSTISQKALFEFDQFVNLLRSSEINVIEFKEDSNSLTPDAVFPNNWISTHGDGTIFLYPMFAKNRRIERRDDIISYLQSNFHVSSINTQMLIHESNNAFLEGTGSMVLDRENKLAYACISKRTDENLFYTWCQERNFQGISFSANDAGIPIYHTNVMMSVSKSMAFVCLDSIVEVDKKEVLLSSFKKTKKDVVNISTSQMNHFLGNVLEVKNIHDESFLIMSTTAFNSLTDSQREKVNEKMNILHSPLDTIEYFGGGSARCMIAEIFLKPNF